MRALSRLGVGLTVVSTLLLLALTAELYYLFVHRRRAAAVVLLLRAAPALLLQEDPRARCDLRPRAARRGRRRVGGGAADAAGEPGRPDAAAVHHQGGDQGGPRVRGGEDGRSRSLGELMHRQETPFLTPASSPVPPEMEKSYNPLFESPAPTASPGAVVAASPQPKFQFLKDAEEKLYRRALAEEAMRASRRSPSPSPAAGEEDGGYITIVVGKNNRVIPLPSPSPPGRGGDK